MLNNVNYVDRRITKSKNALKEALLVLLLEENIDHITITDIVNEAYLNRGTFYKNYQSKEEILDEVLEDVTADLTKAFRAPYQDQQRLAVKSLKASTVTIFDHVAKYSTFYTLIFKKNRYPEFQHTISETLKSLHLQDFSNISFNAKINREFLACYRAYATFGVLKEWVHDGFKYSAGYMADQLVEILCSSQGGDIYRVVI
ncbi:TetR/AcrR family transcriptional regulator [Lentibacillus sediminis]|uniref:TetR/AcrR family transcriptional regulator n=1 Tax=Lentibacillus sediminis TaxID=1940529 RepID=UPI000C1BC142|nr:TetR-like C-terminal domain-containing protein [Lentibacillus sediminis]